jgi:hypothetical protein
MSETLTPEVENIDAPSTPETVVETTPEPETVVEEPAKGGKRKPSEWNLFVKKVYGDEKKKNKDFKFKDALVLASKMMKTKKKPMKKNKSVKAKSRKQTRR